MAALAPAIDERRPEPMDNVSRLDRGHRLGRLQAPRPRVGRAGDRRGQDHRHLLQAELPGAASQARECRVLRERRRGARRGLSVRACAASPTRSAAIASGGQGGQADRAAEEPPNLAELAACGRLCAAPFPAPVQARPRGFAGGICPRRMRAARAEGALEANGRVTDAIYDAGYAGPSGFYSDAKERLGDDTVGVARRRAWRDHPLDAVRQPAWPDADRGDQQGHLPADLRR